MLRIQKKKKISTRNEFRGFSCCRQLHSLLSFEQHVSRCCQNRGGCEVHLLARGRFLFREPKA